MKDVYLNPSWFVLSFVLSQPPEDVAEFSGDAAGGGGMVIDTIPVIASMVRFSIRILLQLSHTR
jgi:hypothetical protein